MATKVYQEEGESIFESEGVKYDLNYILRNTNLIRPSQISPLRLQWCISKDLDPVRVEKADTDVPVLVTIDKGRLLVVDGEHRVSKALGKKLTVIPYILVPSETMRKAMIKKVKR